jgi:hypothetical protein
LLTCLGVDTFCGEAKAKGGGGGPPPRLLIGDAAAELADFWMLAGIRGISKKLPG